MKPGMKPLLIALLSLSASFPAIAAEEEVQADTPVQSNEMVESTPNAPTPAPVIPKMPRESHFDLLLAGGIAGVHTRDSQLQVTSTEIDTLAQTNSYRWQDAEGELGIGYVFYLVDGPRLTNELRWFPTFEPMLNLYYTNLDINGDVYRFKNVLLNDLNYKTTIKNTRLMVDGILTIVSQCQYSVHALLGIGEGWSSVNYHDYADGVDRINLNTKHESNVVWEWGAGVNYAINRRVSLSLDYVWSDLGRMHTSSEGVANGITSPQIVGANFQVTSQTILLGLHVALGK